MSTYNNFMQANRHIPGSLFSFLFRRGSRLEEALNFFFSQRNDARTQRRTGRKLKFKKELRNSGKIFSAVPEFLLHRRFASLRLGVFALK